MTPQEHIPIIRTAEELEDLLTSSFVGVANVNLNRETISLLLSLNRTNRRIKELSVKAYVESFEKFGYESIALMTIDSDGIFADGQHRLLALDRLLKHGVALTDVWQLINVGVSKERTEDIDNGVSRTYSDTLKMHGVIEDKLIATSLKTYAGLFQNRAIKETARVLEEIYNNDFHKVLEIGNFKTLSSSELISTHSYRPPAWVVACFRVCQRHYGTEKMKKVYEQLYNGNVLTEPMVKFRNWLYVNRGNVRFKPHTNDGKHLLGYFFYAVRKCLNGESVCRLYSVALGATIDGFDF